MSDAPVKTLAFNRRARHDYEIMESFECGIELVGTEVKSIRAGRFSFGDAYGWIEEGELWLVAFHVTPYDFGNRYNHDPDRKKRLLVHRQEIKRLHRRVMERGLTLVPLRVYLKKGKVKVELGLGRGRKLYDKRNEIKKRDQHREAQRELRGRF